MPESVNSMATRFEDLAAARIVVAGTNRGVDPLAEAQAAATLALSLRVRDLTDLLSDRLGEIGDGVRG